MWVSASEALLPTATRQAVSLMLMGCSGVSTASLHHKSQLLSQKDCIFYSLLLGSGQLRRFEIAPFGVMLGDSAELRGDNAAGCCRAYVLKGV